MSKFYQQVVRNKKWHFCRSPISEFLEVDTKTKVWHLWDEDHEYIGNFPTKKELLTFIGL